MEKLFDMFRQTQVNRENKASGLAETVIGLQANSTFYSIMPTSFLYQGILII